MIHKLYACARKNKQPKIKHNNINRQKKTVVFAFTLYVEMY